MTVNIPFKVTPHEIEGGGYWAEIEELPGCVAQANTLEELEANLAQAALDWLRETPEKTEEDARQLAEIQGVPFKEDDSYPQPYVYREPVGWTEEDE